MGTLHSVAADKPCPACPGNGRVGLYLSGRVFPGEYADVAQLVAHHLAKVRVAGSNPVVRSRGPAASGGVAERRGNGLQSRLHGFESRLHLGTTERAIGAAVARFLDTEEVTGSNPVSPTTLPALVLCSDGGPHAEMCRNANDCVRHSADRDEPANHYLLACPTLER